MKKQPVAAFRIIINENELSDTLNDLLILKASNKSSAHTNAFIVKLQMLAIKNNMGAVTPAYVQTGRTGVSSSEMLSALLDDSLPKITKAPTFIIDRRGNPNEINLDNYTKEQIEAAKERELYEFTVTGTHTDWHIYLPKPIITAETERRADEIEKNQQLEHHLDTDDQIASELFHKL
jgi:hypothetical protein